MLIYISTPNTSTTLNPPVSLASRASFTSLYIHSRSSHSSVGSHLLSAPHTLQSEVLYLTFLWQNFSSSAVSGEPIHLLEVQHISDLGTQSIPISSAGLIAAREIKLKRAVCFWRRNRGSVFSTARNHRTSQCAASCAAQRAGGSGSPATAFEAVPFFS